MTSTTSIQVLQRAALIIRTIGEHRGGLRLAELGELVDLPKTTIHRIVGALTEEHLVRVDPSGRVWIGSSVLSLARLAATELAEQLRPVLIDLHHAVDETVDLSVLDGASVHFIDQIQSTQRLRAVSTVGSTFPLHCSANGKAFLAALPGDTLDELLTSPLARFTDNTLVDPDELRAELDVVRSEGVAYDYEEHTTGIAAIAAAITDDTDPIAAISITTPADRFEVNEPRLRLELLAATSRARELLSA
ncbi:MAG: IclR family transcriptional regulator [Microthrixaceae bacterium]|nr:IclR family transcriptional regulator [Microthrixaceae bacterium]